MNVEKSPKRNIDLENRHETLLQLFAYGTLKSGFWNHQRFCSQAETIQPAAVWGRLYCLHAGFPAIEVPESMILAHGTADPLADARLQQEISRPCFDRPTGDWDLVHGELVTFSNPQHDLPPIDHLEGFRPGCLSLYQRVLVPAECQNALIAVWIYRFSQIVAGERIEREWRG